MLAYEKHGSGPAVVLAHGAAGSRNHWCRTIEPLARHFSVYAFDLPGFGASPAVPESITLEDYVGLTLESVRSVCPAGKPIRVAGFSFGSLIAAGVAARLGADLDRLVLIGPSGFEPALGRPSYGYKSIRAVRGPNGAVLDIAKEREIHRHNLLSHMLGDPESADDEAVSLQAANVNAMTFRSSRRLSQSNRLPGFLSELSCPVQFIYGESDRAPYPSIEARVERCRPVVDDLRVTVLPNASHWVQYEAADACNAVLLDFLTQTGREQGP